jgi:beta-1,4-mannosyl-glycoprotein beta-1,4-N-acetylglucosaminyltransferase
MPGPTSDAWTNERHQRNAILRGLQTAGDNDLIVVSDVDEIPNPACFSQYRDWWVSASLEQQLFYYRWNNLVHEANGQPVRWTGAKITLLRHLRDYWQTPENLRRKTPAQRTLFNRLKYRLCSSTLRNAGWHWSYLMTPIEASEKIRSFSHTEFSTSEFSDAKKIKERMDSMVDPFGRSYQIKAVSPKPTFPEFVIESLRQHFGDIEDNQTV